MTEFSVADREVLASRRYAICVAGFYAELAERLLGGAREGFALAGVGDASLDVHEVPGAFELPLAAKLCADSGRYAGVVCLGAVIRGETDHYERICAEAARGIQDVALATGVPCSFGVLTCETMEQAIERSGGGRRNQGFNSAVAVLRMALLSTIMRS